MKFLTYRWQQAGRAASTGIWLEGERILDLAAASRAAGVHLDTSSLAALIASGPHGRAAIDSLVDAALAGRLADAVLPAAQAHLLAPIPKPAKNVFCVGRNYREHVAEGHRARGTEVKYPEVPQFFTKPPTAVIGPDEAFILDPAVTRKLDYEVELGVVIGKRGRDIPAERAFDHIFGYTIINDVTARDLQRRHDQWFKGKGLDRSCPMGPWIVDKSEIPDPTGLELTLTVNGEQRQHARVSEMIFAIPTIIASLSAGLTLEPGDVIATGTPSGVGYAMEPPRFLEGGDVVTCEISGIGRLTTPIVAAS